MYETIRNLLTTAVPDLQGINANRYQYNISGGIQEYMEAVLFQHYLETQRLMSYEEAARTLPEGLSLTHDDYVLGIFDMTGELMRFAVTNLATSRSENTDLSVLADMQSLRSELEALNVEGSRALAKDYENKMKTTRTSVEKVENSVYSMLVRGKERPKGWRPDSDDRRGGEEVESY
jgi:predicted translin family RNA/ssDNA-binding protein